MEHEISANELKYMLARNPKIILLDVRSKQEYNEGHLNGSISIPCYEIDSRVQKIIGNKKAVIVVYCEHGNRSKDVAKKLYKLGYENVYNLKNGLDEK